jgi:hypothetical protein
MEEEEEEDEEMEDGEDGGEEKEEEPITKAKDKGKAVGGRVPIFGTMWKTLEDMFMCDSSKVVSMDLITGSNKWRLFEERIKNKFYECKHTNKE